MVWFLGLYRKKPLRNHQVCNDMVPSFLEEFLMRIQVLSSNFSAVKMNFLSHISQWYGILFFWRISDENPSLAFKFFQLLKWTSYRTSYNYVVSYFFEEFLMRIHKISELLYFFKETVFHIIVRCVIRCSFVHFSWKKLRLEWEMMNETWEMTWILIINSLRNKE